MLCSRRATSTTSHTTMTYSTFQNEAVDEALSLEELNDINGAGFMDWLKDKAEDVGDWVEKTFGDGDGKHEWKDDYRDEAFKLGAWILKKKLGQDA